MRNGAAFKDGNGNELRQEHPAVAAHWLQSKGSNGQESSRDDTAAVPCAERSNSSIDYITRSWSHLQPHVREAILTLIDASLPREGSAS
jgi:hypothetical protein